MSYRITSVKYSGGYVALMSTIVISAVLLVMTVHIGQAGWSARFMVTGAEAKAQSRTLALGCSEQVLARVLVDTVWLGGVTTTASLGTCVIHPVLIDQPQVGQVTIRVTTVVGARTTNLVAVYSVNLLHLYPSPLSASLGQPYQLADLAPTLVSLTEVAVMP